VQRHYRHYGRGANGAAGRHEYSPEMSKGKNFEPPDGEPGLQPSAFTTVKSVEEAAAKAIAGKLSNYRRNFHAASSRQLGG
jgi:hypothetical protein